MLTYPLCLRSGSVTRFWPKHKSMRDKTRNRDRTNMKGLRRPHFEVQMSDQWPITGTVNSAINGAVSEIWRLFQICNFKIKHFILENLASWQFNAIFWCIKNFCKRIQKNISDASEFKNSFTVVKNNQKCLIWILWWNISILVPKTKINWSYKMRLFEYYSNRMR